VLCRIEEEVEEVEEVKEVKEVKEVEDRSYVYGATCCAGLFPLLPQFPLLPFL
jgi:hypothetical protein